MIDEDYALALQLQEQFDNENAVFITDSVVTRPDSPKKSVNSPVKLGDDKWEMIDPNPDARTLFVEFDNKYFWGKLVGVEVKWSPRMTLCAGLCVYEGRGGLCSIRLSEPLLKLRPRKDLVETLLHEMIHAYLFVTKNDRDRDGHGPEFQKHMHRLNNATGVNITIYHSFHDEVDAYRQHWWRCNGPCQKRQPFFGYVKRSMNRAPSSNDLWWSEHQQTCGGVFTKVKEPENYGVKKKKPTQDSKTASDSKSNILGWTKPAGSKTATKSSTSTSTSNDFPVDDFNGDLEVSDMDLAAAVDSWENNFDSTQSATSSGGGGGEKIVNNGFFGKGMWATNSDDGKDSSMSQFPGKGYVLGQSSSTTSTNSTKNEPTTKPDPDWKVAEGSGQLKPSVHVKSESNKDDSKIIPVDSKEGDRNSSRKDMLQRPSPGHTGQHGSFNNGGSSHGKSLAGKPKIGSSKNNGSVDIRFWLSDPSRAVGEVLKIPNFVSVSNPNRTQSKAGKVLHVVPKGGRRPRSADESPGLASHSTNKKPRVDNENDSPWNVQSSSFGGVTNPGGAHPAGKFASKDFNDVDFRKMNINERKNDVVVVDDRPGSKVEKIRTPPIFVPPEIAESVDLALMNTNPVVIGDDINSNGTLGNESDMVECPVCSTRIVSSLINYHLDSCLM